LQGHTTVDIYSKFVKIEMKHDSLLWKKLANRCSVVRKIEDFKSEVNKMTVISMYSVRKIFS